MSQNRSHHGKVVAAGECARHDEQDHQLRVADRGRLLPVDLRRSVVQVAANGLGSPGSRSYVDAGTGEDGDCVIAARKAAEVFSDEMRSFSKPPIDLDAWDRTYLRIENRIAAADDECDCSGPPAPPRRARSVRCGSSATTSRPRLEATARRRSTPPRRSAASTTRSTWPPSSRASRTASRRPRRSEAAPRHQRVARAVLAAALGPQHQRAARGRGHQRVRRPRAQRR